MARHSFWTRQNTKPGWSDPLWAAFRRPKEFGVAPALSRILRDVLLAASMLRTRHSVMQLL
jgi:hypothetical protein